MSSRRHIQERLAAAVGDRYDVLDWIGGGGMAGVYLARHRIHGGFCAIKVLAEHFSHDENLVASFMQEARTAASLEGHPHIVRILDIAAGEGLYYLIMNYIEGEDMSSYLEREGRLSPIATATVIAQVADALAWAHERGVVHRDLKPANIRLDSRGQVVVMDFGIAKVGATPSALTQMGATVGTPYYMSPEQIRGQGVDPRSDLYALGVIAYQFATGRRPFEGESHQAIWHAHQTQMAPPPEELQPDIPKTLSFVIQRLLEKDPDKRYQSAADVAEHLERIVQSAPPVKLEPKLGGQLDEWRSKPPSSSTLTRPPAGSSAAPAEEEHTQPLSPPTGSRPAAQPPPAAPASPEQGKTGNKNALPALIAVIALLVLLIAGVAYFGFTPSEPVNEVAETAPAPLPPQIETPTGEMVLAPAGECILGDDSTEWNPRRTLTLPAFYIDRTEVSNRAYKAFCDATGRPYPEDPPDSEGYFEDQPDYPVVNVSYLDAQAYAEWAGKRLPTNEEWEKAARGFDGRLYPWGDVKPQDQRANVEGDADGFEGRAPVDSMPLSVSPFGALHMVGNVAEMTSTPFPVDSDPRWLPYFRDLFPDASETWISTRGGSFMLPRDSEDLLAHQRYPWPDNITHIDVGFRCVRDPEPSHR